METKILIFDFDGTIADSAQEIVNIYNEIAQEYNYRKITKPDLAILRNQSAMQNMRYFKVPLYRLPFIASKVRGRLNNQIEKLKIVEGIASPIQSLKSKGYRLYIVSSNARHVIKNFLVANHLDEFHDIYSVSNLFGKHQKIKALIKLNHWDRSQVQYIGDEVRDIEAARKAGVTSVAVTWGYNTEDVLLKNHPDKILRNTSELATL